MIVEKVITSYDDEGNPNFLTVRTLNEKNKENKKMEDYIKEKLETTVPNVEEELNLKLIGKTVTVKHAYNSGNNSTKAYSTGILKKLTYDFLVLESKTPGTGKKTNLVFPTSGYVCFEII